MLVVPVAAAVAEEAARPNVILCMADDMGWGDPGFNGGQIIQTPHLDAMAAAGLKFNRFYSAAPVCSPTRGSCLTGRHPYRYGVFGANSGHLRAGENSLAELLKQEGYVTGHFGKWHLGTLSPEFSGKGPRRQPKQNYMTPGMSGFDEWFSTEYAVATWDPYDPAHLHERGPWDPRVLYWKNGRNITEGPSGDDSRIIMDQAMPFIQTAAKRDQPFLAVIWFHAPHIPVIGGPRYRELYASHNPQARHYYACITALDEQMGRLRAGLRELGVAENTMLWFCSDNGPTQRGRRMLGQPTVDHPFGSTGHFRGYKGSLYEGGVRVPGLLEWPGHVVAGRVTDVAAVTSDYLPTILDALDMQLPDERPLDGISLLPLIEGRMTQREKPIGFQSRQQAAWSEDRYKLVSNDLGQQLELYDVVADPNESTNLADAQPDRVATMNKALRKWQTSCRTSLEEGDPERSDSD
jgi:arylsulfatase A-like enzyme